MRPTTRFFYDFEATGLQRDCDPISIGIVETYVNHGKSIYETRTFYAEFTDYDINKCDNWVKENVISKLHLEKTNDPWNIKDTKIEIKKALLKWISHRDCSEAEFWADCDLIDRPLLQELLGGSLYLPFGIKYYNFFDINTILKNTGWDLSLPRYEDQTTPHNALFDAQQLKNLYYKINEL